jgi:NAD(P)H-flavin reductase/formate hydrogenlyase subunit 6/NADH:ubiquinone oxidoreductase subunit I
MRWLATENLQPLLKLWSKEYRVMAPVEEQDDVTLVPYDSEKFTLDYINFFLPVKEYLFAQKDELFKWEKVDDTIPTSSPGEGDFDQQILFGIRACDVYGIDYMDRFFQGEFRDDNYALRREKTRIVAVNCVEVGPNCFCKAAGVGPFAKQDFDLLLTPMDGGFMVETGTPQAEELIAMAEGLFTTTELTLKDKENLLTSVEAKFTTQPDLGNIHRVLDASFNHPIWAELAESCIACTGCTNVCPTCTCFNVVEENLNDNEGCRVKYWDSCQSASFTRNAGNHNPRDAVSRVRYRVYDKMKYIEERFDFKGCTGCGRCIDACPSFISIVDIVGRLQEDYAQLEELVESQKDKPVFDISVRKWEGQTNSVYRPQVAVIKDIIQETRNIKRFIVQYEDKSLHENFKLTGQFFEITVFGLGEIAISIPFGPSQKDYFDFCIKKAGKVTTAMHNLKVGDKIGLRGPFGKGFPYEEIKGRDILVVGSGVGLAPVRTMIVQILENKEQFGQLVVIASATTYEGLVYKEDLIEWSKIDGVRVLYALSQHTDKVDAHVGYINDLLPDLGLDWANTTSVVCASPRRIKAVAKDLMKLGMKGTDILTSLETHMRCGVGKCGHCKVGSRYMCVDGPVFNYEEMLALPPEF